ncbi:MAG: cytochrome c biogenesis protein CcsA [Candidatus Riflebacteria bacterium]|nr:cytochrome c biogenesis protein CcsA [Candidatus Riflebacteria bacterium]
MMPFILITGLGYALATLFRLLEKVNARPMALHGTVALVVGFISHLITLGIESWQFSISGTFKVRLVISAVSALLVAVCIFLEQRGDRWFSFFVFPMAIPLAALPAIDVPGLSGPSFQGGYFWLHVSGAITGEFFFLLAALSAASYLYETRRLKSKNRLRAVFLIPPLTRLDRLTAAFTAAGIFFFGAGLIFGALWSLETFKTLNFHEPKRLIAFLLCVYFAIALVGRFVRGWAGPRLAWLVIGGALASLAQMLLMGNRLHWLP